MDGMKKVLLTGATGFIGRNLVKELLLHDVEIIAVVREEHEQQKTQWRLEKNIRLVYCDLEHYSRLPQLIADRDIDVAYHLAWRGVSGPDLRDAALQIANIEGTLELIHALSQMNCRSFVGAGSLHEIESFYEMAEDKPISNLGYMYKAAKLSAHWMGKALAGSKGLRFFWPIVSNAYGDGENSKRLINSIIREMMEGKQPALSPGKQNYDFVYISDVAHAFYLIGEYGVDGTNYFIGSGKVRPLKEYLQKVGDMVNQANGTNVELGFGKIQANVVYLPEEVFSIETLEKDTGFIPKVSFEEGIKRTIACIQDEMTEKSGGP